MGETQLPNIGNMIRTAKARYDENTIAMLTYAINMEIKKRAWEEQQLEKKLAAVRARFEAGLLGKTYGIELPPAFTQPEQLESIKKLGELQKKREREIGAAKALIPLLPEEKIKKMGEYATNLTPEILLQLIENETDYKKAIIRSQTQQVISMGSEKEYMPPWMALYNRTVGNLTKLTLPPSPVTLNFGTFTFVVDTGTLEQLRKIDPEEDKEKFNDLVTRTAGAFAKNEYVKKHLSSLLLPFTKPLYEAQVKQQLTILGELKKQAETAQQSRPTPQMKRFTQAVEATQTIFNNLFVPSVDDYVQQFIDSLKTWGNNDSR